MALNQVRPFIKIIELVGSTNGEQTYSGIIVYRNFIRKVILSVKNAELA